MMKKIFSFAVPICCLSLSLNAFSIFLESEATRKMGYGDWYIEKDGELSLMEHYLAPGHIVIDAGANCGEWSQFALQTEPGISLFAFEPVLPVFNLLNQNLSGYENVHCYNKALCDTLGKGSFHYYDETVERSALSGFYYREVLRGDFQEPKVIEVDLETITHFCSKEGIDRIDFLKIDTEGAEWKVLLGAKEMIAAHKIGVVQFEYGGCYIDAKTTLEEIFHFFRENDYYVFRIVPNGLVYIYEWSPSLENFDLSNYCAVCKEDLNAFLSKS